jgi:hypothetical protein
MADSLTSTVGSTQVMGPGSETGPSSKNPFIPPKDEKALIIWLDEKRNLAKKTLPEYQLKLNLAFMMGEQWSTWDRQQRKFRRPLTRPNDPNSPIRLTFNKIASIAEKTVSKLTKEDPLPEARPASDDDTDVTAAKVATRILTHEMERLMWKRYMVEFLFWPITFGWSYTYVGWDPSQGHAILAEEDTGTVSEGEIIFESVPAFEMVFDTNVRTIREAKWCIRTTVMTKEAIWERFGVMVEGGEHGRPMTDEIYDLTDNYRSSYQQEEGYQVHQYWMLPSRAAEKGLVVTWCGQQTLEAPMDFPYKHGKMPFVPFTLLPGMGVSEGRTWVKDLIPMQTDYNDARSREAALRRTLTPKVLSPIGSIDAQRLTSRIEIVPYLPTGGKPEWWTAPANWMAQYEAGMQRSSSEMGERSGSDEPDQQGAAGMPAAAILALQEQSDTKLAVSAKLLAASIGEVGWQMLMLVKQFWTEERTVRTWSEDGDLEADQFSQADVENVMDVHVNAESALPRSKAARTQLIMQLLPMGLFPDPRIALRMLDIPGAEFLMEHINTDAKQAQRENTQLARGLLPPVNPFDNHHAHIQEHDNERKGQTYQNLPDVAPPGTPCKAKWDAHVAAHMEQLVPAGLNNPASAGPTLDPAQQPPAAGSPAEMAQHGAVQGTPPSSGVPMYVNSQTGQVNDPLQAAAGQTPSALSGTAIARRAGIGGPAQPGHVPGVGSDQQAASMGQ